MSVSPILIPGVLILYYLAARYWIRSRTTPSVVVTQYTPPQNLSPGALRYCFTGSFDPEAIAATALHLAARGLVTFKGLDEYYAILRTSEPLPHDLPREELALYNKMFNFDKGGTAPFPGRLRTYEELPKDAFLLPPAEGPVLVELCKAIYDSLPPADRNLYFTDHLPFSLLGSFVSLYITLLRIDDPVMRWFAFLLLFLGIAGFLAFGSRPDFHPSRDPSRAGDFVLVFILVITTIMLGVFIAPASPAFQFALLAVVILNLALPALLREPTEAGRTLLDQIAGYRNFLSSVEVDRMYRLKSPGWRPSPATANLAYAIALDLGDAWQDYLANAGFRTVAWERDRGGDFPRKREIRTASTSAWVDRWSMWLAFAVTMIVLSGFVTFLLHILRP